ncbi:hypothetical protein FB451DRAFT_1568096 [Mycena latifolia]|nr:hypothetical protein FB451DRAFT_1568096 [Mycena latifolia]
MAAPAEWAVQSLGDPLSTSSARRPPAPQIPVCDDWEDDNDNDDDAAEDPPHAPADNQRIWDDANALAPMPALIISGVSAMPPPAAFQPAMRILKRPAAPAPAAAPPVGSGETLRDREARYQEARERIFGREAEGGGGAKEGTGEGAEKETKSGVARNPCGPHPATTAAQTGFKPRSGRPPPPTPVRDPDAAALWHLRAESSFIP